MFFKKYRKLLKELEETIEKTKKMQRMVESQQNQNRILHDDMATMIKVVIELQEQNEVIARYLLNGK